MYTRTCVCEHVCIRVCVCVCVCVCILRKQQHTEANFLLRETMKFTFFHPYPYSKAHINIRQRRGRRRKKKQVKREKKIQEIKWTKYNLNTYQYCYYYSVSRCAKHISDISSRNIKWHLYDKAEKRRTFFAFPLSIIYISNDKICHQMNNSWQWLLFFLLHPTISSLFLFLHTANKWREMYTHLC